MTSPGEQTEERAILRLEQDGEETCELSPNSSFVRIHMPLRVLGEGLRREAIFHYDLGPFSSRDISLIVEPDRRIDLRFRLPKELFRSQEHLLLEVFYRDRERSKNVMWSARYEVDWQGEAPCLVTATD